MSLRLGSLVFVAAAALIHSVAVRADERPRTILVTGFEPFGGSPINPSWQAARRLDGKVMSGFRIHAVQLPVDTNRVDRILAELLRSERPDAYVAFGMNSLSFDVEHRADNVMTRGQAESAGVEFREDTLLKKDAPAFYETTLPVAVIRAGLVGALPDEQLQDSTDAGDYVCESTFFQGRYYFEKLGLTGPMGFVHIPSAQDSAAIERAARGVEGIVAALARSLADRAGVGQVGSGTVAAVASAEPARAGTDLASVTTAEPIAGPPSDQAGGADEGLPLLARADGRVTPAVREARSREESRSSSAAARRHAPAAAPSPGNGFTHAVRRSDGR